MGLCISKHSGSSYSYSDSDRWEVPVNPSNARSASSHQTASASYRASDEEDERPATFSHFQLARCGGDYTLSMVSLAAYQAERRHRGNLIKDRSQSILPWVQVYHSETGLDYSFQIDRTTTVKVAGFNCNVPNDGGTRHLYSAGTSQVNMPVIADNMSACIAVACAAENVDAGTGGRRPGAKVRVFHLLPFRREDLMPEQVLASVRDYLRDIKEQGLTMRVALHGGNREGDFSVSTAEALKSLFADEGIPIEFDETCANRTSETLLGAVILNDNSTQFIKHLVAL
ncbi:XopAF/AvrXv3 family type III secretion system effector [Pseudomonas syringae]|uniref:XopAF/AvrXv3 family type III secretion system effector n=2 Tax=Pseudomonas syringae TaxID=317 RepID=UPI001F0E51B8|nr:XopAF/AvrXv3 family type III secretion system effector [Pseudomonas syringae]MCH5489590.1 type III effector [Pseudomonas syringae pv. syringae]MDO1460337.1 type III effector [Pseudomonas syringae pv. syringae]